MMIKKIYSSHLNKMVVNLGSGVYACYDPNLVGTLINRHNAIFLAFQNKDQRWFIDGLFKDKEANK